MKMNLIGLGGAGTNNVKRYLENGHFNDAFQVLALDTSEANFFQHEKVIFEHVPGTVGSGSDQALNADKYPDFLKRIITQYEIEGLVVLVYSGSGGTGSSMGPTMHQMLAAMGICAVSIVIGDMTDINRGSNTIRSLLNLVDITDEGYPAFYAYYQNGKSSQGSINQDVTSFIDMVRVVFSTENGRIDQKDVEHLFFYNRVVKATPALSCLEFVTGNNIAEYKKNPVAALSLYDNEDNIQPAFENLLYSKEGIFKAEWQNTNFASVHAVLDHGDSLKGLEKMLADQRVVNSEVNDRFQSTTSTLREKVGSEKKGGFKKYDI